jgi:hypothetical protein
VGICVPVASVSGTFLVQLFTGNRLAMFMAPCVIGGSFILLFAASLKDRRLAKADKPTWSLWEFVWELSLGIYLMVKGFKPSSITAATTADTTPSAYRDVTV